MAPSTTISEDASSTEVKSAGDLVGNTPGAQSEKPLDELFLVAKGVAGLGGYLNMGIDLAFHSSTHEPALYNLEITGLWGRTTTMHLRKGAQQKGKCIASCTFYKFSPDTDLEIQEGSSTMTRVGHNDHYWVAEGINFTWKYTPQVPGKQSTFVDSDWKLTNRDSGEVHAVYVANPGNSKHRGQVQFRRSLGLDWEKAVLLTLGAVVERVRQKQARRGSILVGMMAY
ncbi:hypothetical protein BP5796_02152 [Coleophoma crateriformis]|uniref:Uncharacterized protein n=1 Tax=Coleophoma crateriformis TaxID=565419 RepID=A0A3D8SXD2_9HELO|nr:hypothetical protein BP5796_02152 [Coleophoma crateriformis]